MIGTVVSLLLLYLHYKKKCNTAYYILIYLYLRQAIRMLDFENTRQGSDGQVWSVRIITQTAAMTLTSTILGSSYPYTCSHKIVMNILYCAGMFAFLCGVSGFKEIVEDPSVLFTGKIIIVPIGVACFVFHLNITNKINTDFVHRIFEKIKSKEEYKYILDRLEHSIIIIENG